MPHISISMYSGRSEETKQEIAQKAKAAVAQACGFPPDALSVSITEFSAESFVEEVQKRCADEVLYETSDYIK